ncbi:MAG TPA: hypothetical protein VGB62_06460 [Allosphingosinicella sp.]|jgi:hypothetical protein
MPVSNTSIVERIARVIAGRVVSINAEGQDPSAGPRVDDIWHDHVDDALSVLRTLREPDSTMAAAGDADVWERMVLAALEAEDTRGSAS